jgi:hypothetical protein
MLGWCANNTKKANFKLAKEERSAADPVGAAKLYESLSIPAAVLLTSGPLVSKTCTCTCTCKCGTVGYGTTVCRSAGCCAVGCYTTGCGTAGCVTTGCGSAECGTVGYSTNGRGYNWVRIHLMRLQLL